MTEEVILFGSSGTLVGIVSDPPDPPGGTGRPAVILLNAGVVHRVGPNRLYVKLARRLASEGNVVFRFDFSGVGDSGVRKDSLPVERSAIAESREAMDYLAHVRNADRFVLMAICSGAGFSFQTASFDDRVVGLALINAAGHLWGSSDELSRTSARHERRMLSIGFSRARNWRKLLALDFNGRAAIMMLARGLRGLFAGNGDEVETASGYIAQLESLIATGVRVLVLYSEGDQGLDYFELFLRDGLRPLESEGQLTVKIVLGADHTFTLVCHQDELLDLAGRWIEQVSTSRRRPDGVGDRHHTKPLGDHNRKGTDVMYIDDQDDETI